MVGFPHCSDLQARCRLPAAALTAYEQWRGCLGQIDVEKVILPPQRERAVLGVAQPDDGRAVPESGAVRLRTGVRREVVLELKQRSQAVTEVFDAAKPKAALGGRIAVE